MKRAWRIFPAGRFFTLILKLKWLVSCITGGINQGNILAAAQPVKPVNPTQPTDTANSAEGAPTPATKAAVVKVPAAGPNTVPAVTSNVSSATGNGTQASSSTQGAEDVVDAPTTSDVTPESINETKRVVDEVVALMGDIHDAKEEIMARGIPFHTVNVMVELGVHGKLEEQAGMRKTALETSQKQHGPAAITAEKLDEHLETLVALEKDLGHVRKLGKDQGLDMTSVNYLTLIIRQNPGDGGEKVVNTFLAYALACDIPLHRVTELAEQATSGPKSVLPDIPREEQIDAAAAERKRWITDICIGCLLALGALAVLT